MSATIYLSHFISCNTPLYGGEQAIKISEAKSISKGDSCNTKNLSFPNHSGTHIDFPLHFSNSGKTIKDYSPGDWIFYRPFLFEYDSKPAEIIDFSSSMHLIPANTDFLIIRTRFQRFRNSPTYWQENPGISPALASGLRKHCNEIRAIGFDFISLSSYQHRQIGRDAHREFLVNNDILVIEDMDLSRLNGHITKIICLPLLIDDIDGVPVNIIAELEQ